MDEYSGKRATGGFFVPRKGSGLILRDTNNPDQNSEFCNRLGCSGRINYTKRSQVGFSEKARSSRSFRTSNGKEIIGSTSRSSPLVTNARKSCQDSRMKLSSSSSQLNIESQKFSSVQDVHEVPDCTVTSLSTSQNKSQLGSIDVDSTEVTLNGAGSSSVAANCRSQKIISQKSGIANQHSFTGSYISPSSGNSSQSRSNYSSGNKYNFRNLRCSSFSDVLPQGCSSSESNIGRRRDVMKKVNPGESSSSVKGKKICGPSADDGRMSLSGGGLSISDSRRTRNWSYSRDKSAASGRTRRPVIASTSVRSSNQANGNNLSSAEPFVLAPEICQLETPNSINVPSSSRQFPAEASIFSSSYSSASTDDTSSGITPISSTGLGMTHLMDSDGMRQYNMDMIAEVLMALERIERDEELTYEQLLTLETNIFLGVLNFDDQHRGMRMDIDNMSYEELLALEERMGTVSTALSEDALSKCLTGCIYNMPSAQPKEVAVGSSDGDDTKCSICQEEYKVGDEVGKLGCEHGYHSVCIRQWLRMKNWCPICKASAAPS